MHRQRHILSVLCACIAMLALAPAAHADRAYTQRFVTSQKGTVVFLGNTLESCSGNGGGCPDAKAGNNNNNNGDYNMAYVDVDGDASTFNSSTSTLTLPAGASITWAGLYWGGDTATGSGGCPGARTGQQAHRQAQGAGRELLHEHHRHDRHRLAAPRPASAGSPT